MGEGVDIAAAAAVRCFGNKSIRDCSVTVEGFQSNSACRELANASSYILGIGGGARAPHAHWFITFALLSKQYTISVLPRHTFYSYSLAKPEKLRIWVPRFRHKAPQRARHVQPQPITPTFKL